MTNGIDERLTRRSDEGCRRSVDRRVADDDRFHRNAVLALGLVDTDSIAEASVLGPAVGTRP